MLDWGRKSLALLVDLSRPHSGVLGMQVATWVGNVLMVVVDEYDHVGRGETILCKSSEF